MEVICISMILLMSIVPKGRSIWTKKDLTLELNTAHRLTRIIDKPPSQQVLFIKYTTKKKFHGQVFR